MNRQHIFCLLQFFGTFSSTISLCMSSYGLAYNLNKSYTWEHILTVTCILVSIIVHSIKDGLLTNPEVLKKKEEQIEI